MWIEPISKNEFLPQHVTERQKLNWIELTKENSDQDFKIARLHPQSNSNPTLRTQSFKF